MKQFKKSLIAVAATVSTLGLAGCFGGSNTSNANIVDAFLLGQNNELVRIDVAAPGTSLGSVTLGGFNNTDEVVIGIDFRPFNGNLYVVTKDAVNAGRVYTANQTTGAVTFIAKLTADPADTAPNSVSPATPNASFTTLLGNNFGVDFNPAADALRVVSDAGQNLRIFVDSDRRGKTAGFTITDGELTGGTAGFAVTAAAYTNSFEGTSSTALWDIDTANDRLVRQDANPGGLTDAGSIGVDANAVNGFDISAENNTGYAVLNVGGTSKLYTLPIPMANATLPLTSAAATEVGNTVINNVKGLALRPNQNPTVVGLNGTLTAPSLVKFALRTPNTISSTVNVTGLSTGDQLLSIDFRPATGELFGLVRNGTSGKLVTINPSTGATTFRANLVDQADGTTPIVLDANKTYNIDFNPMADALRIVSSSTGGAGGDGENRRAFVETTGARTAGFTFIEPNVTNGGDLQVDTAATTPAANDFDVQQVAYINSYGNTSNTALYDIDATNDDLLNQAPANSGKLNKVGDLTTTNFNAYAGFDITGGDNGARIIAARETATGPFSLYNVDVFGNGAATPAGVVTGQTNVIGGTNSPTDLRDITMEFNLKK